MIPSNQAWRQRFSIEVVKVVHSFLAVAVLHQCPERNTVGRRIGVGAAVHHPTEIFQSRDGAVVSGHLIDMVCPNLIEALKYERCLCIGVLCVGETSTGFFRTNVLIAVSGDIPYDPKGARKFSTGALKISELPFGQSLANTRFKLGLHPKIRIELLSSDGLAAVFHRLQSPSHDRIVFPLTDQIDVSIA